MTDIPLDREAMILLEELLEAAPADVDAWLAARTAGRPDLRQRIDALVAADLTGMLRTGGAVDDVEETPAPDHLGGYRILETIGHGGMGSVYRAERERGDFAHAVAIKIIKPGLLSARLVERFRTERQTLALLNHPNIARLFDGGETDDGHPYIVMEHVDGRPLLEWADAHAADSKVRTGLFLQICSAVGFAHRNLIVHRDITPSNVLVTGDGLVKLIDFGIARALEGAGSGRKDGAHSLQSLSLTPGYAAPERLSGAAATTAADIYSLGKLLQKLMAGDARDQELDAIIDRATAADPQQRYPTVEELAADIEAWRGDRPVAAYQSLGRGGGQYVLRKFLGRHRIAAGATAAVVVLLLAAFVGTAMSFLNARAAREAEAARFEEVRSLAHYMLFDLNDQLRGVPGNTAARADMAQKAQVYLDALSHSSGASRDLRYETALGFIRLARIQDSPLDRNLGMIDEAQTSLANARSLLETIRTSDGDANDLAIAEAQLEAIAGLIAFYEETDAEGGWERFIRARDALGRVAPADRTPAWYLAQRDVSRAEMEHHSANEEMDKLLAAADAHATMVGAWPAELKAGNLADVERAYATYNHGLALSLTDKESAGYPEMRAAHDVFAAAERLKPGDPDLLYMIGWTGADAYAAAARIDLAREAEDLLVSASVAAKRLVAIEDKDESARVLNVMVGESYSQHLGNVGRFKEAFAEQQAIIDVKQARLTELKTPSARANLAWSQMILGQIAKQGGDRKLACESWGIAEENFSAAEQAGKLNAFWASFLPGLREHKARCTTSDPISAFGLIR